MPADLKYAIVVPVILLAMLAGSGIAAAVHWLRQRHRNRDQLERLARDAAERARHDGSAHTGRSRR